MPICSLSKRSLLPSLTVVLNSNLMIPDLPHITKNKIGPIKIFLLRPDFAKFLPSWLSQSSCTHHSKIKSFKFLIPCMKFEFFVSKYLHLMCLTSAISKRFQKCVIVSSKSRSQVNPGQKVPFLERTHIWQFHSCYYVSII